MIVDEDGALGNSTDINYILVNDFSICMENTDGYSSCINVKNEIHNRSIKTWLYQALLTVISMEINGVVQNKRQL